MCMHKSGALTLETDNELILCHGKVFGEIRGLFLFVWQKGKRISPSISRDKWRGIKNMTDRRHVKTLRKLAQTYREAEENSDGYEDLMAYEFLQEAAKMELEIIATETSKHKKKKRKGGKETT